MAVLVFAVFPYSYKTALADIPPQEALGAAIVIAAVAYVIVRPLVGFVLLPAVNLLASRLEQQTAPTR